jgi:hypothetical protein
MTKLKKQQYLFLRLLRKVFEEQNHMGSVMTSRQIGVFKCFLSTMLCRFDYAEYFPEDEVDCSDFAYSWGGICFDCPAQSQCKYVRIKSEVNAFKCRIDEKNLSDTDIEFINLYYQYRHVSDNGLHKKVVDTSVLIDIMSKVFLDVYKLK